MRRSGGEDFSDYAVETVWKNVDLRTAEGVTVGETLYDASGEVFGCVISVEMHPSVVELRWEGRIRRVESPERFDVQIRVAVSGREADGQLLCRGGGALMIGQARLLYSATAEMSLLITSIGEKMPS
jgi:hypothetical protein